MITIEYTLSLIAAFLYAVSVLFIKRALAEGAGTMRVTFILNIFMVLAFAPLLCLEHIVHDWSLLWSALIVSICLFVGQICVFAALRFGDASIQTPVMGTKAFMVAIFATLLGYDKIPLTWWLGSIMTIIAIYFLSYSDGCPILKKSNTITIILAFVGASFFGLGDVIMGRYAPFFGEIPFLIISIGGAALGSCTLIPFFEGPLHKIPKNARSWVFWGNFIYAVEALAFYIAISFYGKATAANILYSSRGLWSLVLVYTVGNMVGNSEKYVGQTIMKRRFLGALLIFLAMILVFI